MGKTTMKREWSLMGQQASKEVRRTQGWGMVLILVLVQGSGMNAAIAQLPPPPDGSRGTLLSPTQLPQLPPAQIQTLIQQQLGIDPSTLNQILRMPGNLPSSILQSPIGLPTQSILPGMGGALSPSSLVNGVGGFQPQGINSGLSPGSIPTGLNSPLSGGTRIEAPTGLLPGGMVQVEQIAGGNSVRITQAGNILGLEIPVGTQGGTGGLAALTPTALPQLLTSGSLENASNVVVENGQVRLVSSGGGALAGGSGTPLGGQPFATTPGMAGPSPGGLAPSPSIQGSFGGPGTLTGGTLPLAPNPSGGMGLPSAPLAGALPAPPMFPGSFRGFEGALRSMVAADFALGRIDRAVLRTDQLLQSQYERYYGRKIQHRASQSADDFRAVLSEISAQTGTKPAIVYFVFQPNQLEIAVLAPGIKSFYRSVPVKRKTLLQLAADFRTQITNPSNQGYLPSAQKLYSLLFEPIAPLLEEQGIDTLLVVPDSGLRSLPLVALHDGQRFLVEKWSVSLIPSVSLTDLGYTSLRNATVLAMGASVFREQAPLPAVPTELDTVVKELGRGESLLNQSFTIDNLKASRQKQFYSIVHLATHGEFRPGTSRNSYIQFWDRKLNLRDIGLLQLDRPPVELLVLSACRTALGDEQAEYGFAGLAVQAGVRSALASLWYVSDTGTLGLMTEFYNQLRIQKTKAEALRAAQIAMIHGKIRLEKQALVSTRGSIPLSSELLVNGQADLSHPYYWAAFTLIGSPW